MNDVIMRHDALWPGGLNELLYVQTPLEVAELRQSCLRHRWPPADAELQPRETQLNLTRLRARLQQQVAVHLSPVVMSSTADSAASGETATKKVGTYRAGAAGRTPSASTVQQTSPTKSTHQPGKSSLPSPTNRRPATMTKSNTASSPTKSPRSRPQSAPKPPPPATTSSRPPQPSASTPRSRSQSAKSTPGSGSKPGRSTVGRLAAATAETESTSVLDTTTAENGSSLSQPHHENTEHATAESSELVISTLQNETCDCATAIGYQQIPATV